MKIGIIGSGPVGQALGTAFVKEGHQVKLGTRKPDDGKVTQWVKQAGPNASAGTFADAAKFADLAVLATKWDGGATENAIKLADPKHLAGKVVIDATNPLTQVPYAPLGLALGFSDSAGEQVQRWLRGAKVVKTFNTVTHANMYKPRLEGGPPDMFLCGDDAQARATVAEICRAFGWVPVDIGAMTGARLLEPLAVLYCVIAIQGGGWNLAWRLLREKR
jgi:8-hydroxy-5-deazaflavin:NADPH oxidoreductase